MECNIISSQSDNQDDDFDIDDESFDDFGDTGSEKKRGIPKIAIIIGVILAIVVLMFLLGGGSQQEVENSIVRGGSDVKQDVGTQELDAAMLEATEILNEDNRMDAEDQGASFIPIPTVSSQESFEEKDILADDDEDPLEAWKSMQSERMRQEQFEREVKQQQVVSQKRTDQRASRQEVVTQIATAMSSSLEQIVEGKEIKPLSHNFVTDEETFFEDLNAANLAAQVQLATMTSREDGTIPTEEALVILPATTIEYGQTLIEANSDVPGPVLAELVTGPLKGARLLGSFTKESNYLVIEFNTAVLGDKSYSIDAIVLDPDTTLPAVATDVDKRWLRRIILPTAASFISGLGAAIAETSNTSVSVQGETVATETTGLDTEEEIAKAVEEAAEKISELIDEEADEIEVLVKVRSGTPIGILFLSPVVETPDVQPGGTIFIPDAAIAQPTISNITSSVSALPSVLQNLPGITSLPIETLQGAAR